MVVSGHVVDAGDSEEVVDWDVVVAGLSELDALVLGRSLARDCISFSF